MRIHFISVLCRNLELGFGLVAGQDRVMGRCYDYVSTITAWLVTVVCLSMPGCVCVCPTIYFYDIM